MKRYGFLYEQVCSFETLYAAAKKALRGHKTKPEAAMFFFNLDVELHRLQEELESGSYRPQAYRYFEIYEPKQRTISVAAFRDRVVHHALVMQLEPIFEKTFIYHSYATRKNKGSLKAIKQAQINLRKHQWFLKLDIKKYFDSIDHDILINQIKHKIKDARLIDLIEKILDTSSSSQEISERIGLPIGNLTSQFFANVYLNSFDHYVLEKLRFPYIRYMDDILLFADDKLKLKQSLKECECYLNEILKLEIKPGSIMINNSLHGLSFLGFRIFPALIRLKQENIKRLISKLKQRHYQYQHNMIDEDCLYRSVQSMLAFADIANSKHLIKNMCHNLG